MLNTIFRNLFSSIYRELTAADVEAVSLNTRLREGTLRDALLNASRGGTLSDEEREELALVFRDGGKENLFVRRLPKFGEEDRMANAQIIMLGRDLRKALLRASDDGVLSIQSRAQLKNWLDISTKTQRKFFRRRYIFYVGYAITVLVIAFLVVWRLPINGLSRIEIGGPGETPIMMMFITCVAVLVAAIFKDLYLDRNIDRGLDDVRVIARRTREDVNDLLETNLQPRITALDSPEKVIRSAIDILQEASQVPKEERFVVFIGAGSLSSEPDSTAPEDRVSLSEDYKNRLVALDAAKVKVTRYIALFDSKPNPPRKKETVKRYLAWMDKQMAMLASHSHYTLVNSPRAQPWGGSRSSIITSRAYLDIVGEGEAGFLVRGEEIARTLHRSSEKLLSTANNEKPYKGDSESLERLKKKKELLLTK